MRRFLNNLRHHRNWWAYYRTKYTGGFPHGFIFRWRCGRRLRVPRRLLHTYKESFFDRAYFRGFPAAMQKLPIRTAVDVGANAGYFSLFLLSRFPRARVWAYEPIPTNFELLEQYRQAHPDLELHTIPKAVTAPACRTLTLHYERSDSYTTSASIRAGSEHLQALEVEATSLSDILAEHQLEELDFLKLDCEGSEYDILFQSPDHLLRRIRRMAIETHPGPTEREQGAALAGFLRKKGFALRREGDLIWAWRA
jgi:FkbM family methyltransferase